MAIYKPRRDAWNRSFPHSPQKEPTLPTPWFWISSLQNCEAINLLFKPSSLQYCITAALVQWWWWWQGVQHMFQVIYYFLTNNPQISRVKQQLFDLRIKNSYREWRAKSSSLFHGICGLSWGGMNGWRAGTTSLRQYVWTVLPVASAGAGIPKMASSLTDLTPKSGWPDNWGLKALFSLYVVSLSFLTIGWSQGAHYMWRGSLRISIPPYYIGQSNHRINLDSRG